MGLQFNLAGASFTTGKIVRDDTALDYGSLALVDFTHSATKISSYAPATGAISFPAQPTAGDTITLNGVVITFVASGAAGNQVNIGADLTATLANLLTFLTTSQNASLLLCNYATNATSKRLGITYKTSNLGDNFTLAASVATVSAPTLKGQNTPADTATVTNLAWREAAKLGGALAGMTESTGNMVASRSGGPVGSLFQRSTKGSLVGIESQVSQSGGMIFTLPAPVIAWVTANPTHRYGIYSSTNYLRTTTNSNAAQGTIGASPSNNITANVQEYARSLGEQDSWNIGTVNGVSPPSGYFWQLFAFGGTSLYGSLATNAHASKVLRSVHFVDLTAWLAGYAAIGVVKAEADWIVQQRAITTARLAAGGRWNGDTWVLNPANFA
jgi:hypothetical protein